jgi:hypothetical protein
MLVAVKRYPATSATIRISKLLLKCPDIAGAMFYLPILTSYNLAFPVDGF